MDDLFDKALEFTLRWEGGYVNHPSDPGGPTNFGITQKVYNEYLKNTHSLTKSVKLITKDEVKYIYKSRYWEAAGCEKLEPRLAVAVFDFAVNSGVYRAQKYQRICNNDADLLTAKRRAFLIELGQVPRYRPFLRGWLNRIEALQAFLARLGA